MWYLSLTRYVPFGSPRTQTRHRRGQAPRKQKRPHRLVVETLEDRMVLSPYIVTTTADWNPNDPSLPPGYTIPGSLRDAITQIDMPSGGYPYASPSDPSRDEIDFNITAASDTGGGYNATTGVATITPQSAFPPVTNSVFINGYTQPGASQNTLLGPCALGSTDSTLHPGNYGDNAVLKIELDGANAGNATGLVLNSPNTTVQGLVINRFAEGGISVYYGGGPGDVVQGNFLGTDVTGTQALGNSGADIYVNSGPATQGVTIGGTVPAARNIISGSGALPNAPYTGYGIDIGGGAEDYVEGNFIGTDVTGTQPLGNAYAGIELGNGVLVGGVVAGAGNIISGNREGIDEVGPTSLIEGNFIGTDVQGTAALGNTTDGIGIRPNGATIGGTAPGAGNVISGNPEAGVRLGNVTNTQIQANLIGTDCTGTKVIGNGYAGILMQDGGNSNLIGGPDTNAAGAPLTGGGNVICGGESAIYIQFWQGTTPSSGNMVEGNYIGTNITGTMAINNNTGTGVFIGTGCANNTIGGQTPGTANIISGYGTGVFIGPNGNGGTLPYGVAVLGNSIYGNDDGISIAGGCNDNQVTPVLTSATATGSSTTITGTLQSVPSRTFRVEFFANAAADPSGYGQGQTFLGFTTVSTDASGNASFTATLTFSLPANQTILSATATNLTTGDTSEFAFDVSIPVVAAISGAPSAPISVNTAINVSASFTDAGLPTTHTATWSWGDNSSSTDTVPQGNSSVTGSHSYTTDGVYTVTLTVANPQGGSGQSVFQFVVIYNPNGGFVTGGGWITSPAGAIPNTTLTGKATFGFNSQYKPGRSVPSGDTEFQFQVGNLDFHSTSYDWLTILPTQNMAQYQGNGTINGTGNYQFVLTGVDGDLSGGTGPDAFRIRIWDPNQGNGQTSSGLIYDNSVNAPPGSLYNDPTGTPLGGGAIVIHKSNQTAVGGPGPQPGTGPLLTMGQLQPIVTQALARWQEAGATAAQLSPLAQLTYEIVSLPPGILAMTGPGIIWVSPDADGYGWFLDPTPTNDSSFTGLASSPAQDHMDLLSVMAHELGHIVLSMDESSQPNDVMTEALPLGERRLPTPYDLGLQPSATWASSHTSTGLKEPHLTADEVSVLLRDSLFASGLQTSASIAASPVQQSEALTPDPVMLALTVQDTETLFAARQPEFASYVVHRTDLNKQTADAGESWLADGFRDQLAHDAVR